VVLFACASAGTGGVHGGTGIIKMKLLLITWAVVASVVAVVGMNNFKERADSMNDLTAKLTRWEVEHKQCLGHQIDYFFWLDGCPLTIDHGPLVQGK
jgi:hypothetical protein